MKSVTDSSGTTNYTINALGQRVKKAGPLGTRLFVYVEAGHLLGEYDGSGALVQETVWMGDIPVATLRPNGSGGVNHFYVHSDHLNTPRRISRPSDNVVVWRWDSDPFGSSAANEDPDGDSTVFAYSLRFPGQYHDAESGLSYNYLRDGYDSAVGRYTQSDPIGLLGGVNTYAYVAGNPVAYVDPRGLQILVCSRKAAGAFKLFNANHGYLWDTRNGKACGANGSSGMGQAQSSQSEGGPTVDECNPVWASEGKEDRIMKCCEKAGDRAFIPFASDCQARQDDCIRDSGLHNPGSPGGRFGDPHDPWRSLRSSAWRYFFR